MTENYFKVKAKFIPVLDPKFRPAVLEFRGFLAEVCRSGKAVPLKIAVERNNGQIATFETVIFDPSSKMFQTNFFYIERLVKSLLWQKGGWKIIIGGCQELGEYFKNIYVPGGIREFDAKFMSRVYEQPFTVDIVDFDKVPPSQEDSKPIGRHLNGCRIGFDAGGSDRKVSAVIDGHTVYSEEVIWHPKLESNPDYHYQEILTAMRSAASHMPRVDAIGVSAAGVYVNNRAMVASLFIKVPEDLFDKQVKNIFARIQKEMGGAPLEVANDGDVTALAGAMDLNDSGILGIAMGTSEAGGYIDNNGNVTGWLNELAFIPVDFNSEAMVDEWSGDFGCGVKYFSQDAVIKLAAVAEIRLAEQLTPAEKLKEIQNLMEQGDPRARQIFSSLGCYLGYGVAHYATLYEMKHVLILGRVTSGEGGKLMLQTAQNVLQEEFPELAQKIKLLLPDESSRRIGQSIAAASLPEIKT